MEHESPTLFVVLTVTDLGGVIYARSRGGLMVYESFGSARGAVLGWLRERRKRGFADVAVRIVPIGATETLRWMWEQYEHTEVRSAREAGEGSAT